MKETTVKNAFDKVYPAGLVFVISVDKNKRPSGMIACFQMKCSVSPPLLAIAISKKGYTHKLIRSSKEFVISVPNKKILKELKFFGDYHGDIVDKFAKTKIKTSKAKYIDSPLLKEATINFECKLKKEIDTGDHIMFIGEVLASHINNDKKVLIYMGKKNGKRVYKEF